MKQRTITILTILLLAVWTAGCGADDKVYLEQAGSGMADSTEDTEKSSGDGPAEPGTEATAQVAGGNTGAADEAGAVGSGTQTSAGTDAAGMQASEAGDAAGQCYVYVCGEVKSPGVYILPPGARIFEAVAQAGGMTENAGATAVNLAGGISDGQMVYIPTKEETETMPAAGQGTDSVGEAASDSPQAADDRVDLNTASETELMTLSGIGQAKAEAILAYRETHGGFSSVEEIMNVDGIKEGLYNRIKDDIKVK